jgi:hypothetical protein
MPVNLQVVLAALRHYDQGRSFLRRRTIGEHAAVLLLKYLLPKRPQVEMGWVLNCWFIQTDHTRRTGDDYEVFSTIFKNHYTNVLTAEEVAHQFDLLGMLAYRTKDLLRAHPESIISIVDIASPTTRRNIINFLSTELIKDQKESLHLTSKKFYSILADAVLTYRQDFLDTPTIGSSNLPNSLYIDLLTRGGFLGVTEKEALIHFSPYLIRALDHLIGTLRQAGLATSANLSAMVNYCANLRDSERKFVDKVKILRNFNILLIKLQEGGNLDQQNMMHAIGVQSVLLTNLHHILDLLPRQIYNANNIERLLNPRHRVLLEQNVRVILDTIPAALFIQDTLDQLFQLSQGNNALVEIRQYVNRLIGVQVGAVAALNNPQNIHTDSVHSSISTSIIRLEQHYGQQIDQHSETNTLSEIKNYLGVRAITEPTETERQVYVAAKSNFIRMTTGSEGEYRGGEGDLSGISTRRIVVLLWQALHDDTQRSGTLQDGLDQLVREGFYANQRAYSSGPEDIDRVSCLAGCRLRVVAAVAANLPDMIQVIFLNPGAAAFKLKAVAKEETLELLKQQANPQTAQHYDQYKKEFERIKSEGVSAVWERIKQAVIAKVLLDYGTIFSGGEHDPAFINLVRETKDYIEFDSDDERIEQIEKRLEQSPGHLLYQSTQNLHQVHFEEHFDPCARSRRKRNVGSNGCRLLPKAITELANEEVLRDYAIVQRLTTVPEQSISGRIGEVAAKRSRGSTVVSHINDVFQGYQVLQAMRSGDSQAIIYSLSGIGFSVVGGEMGEAVLLLRNSKIVPLQIFGRVGAPLVSTTIAGIPMIIGLVQDIKRLQTGDQSALPDVIMDSALVTLSLIETGMLIVGAEVGPEGMIASIIITVGLESYHASLLLAEVQKYMPLGWQERLSEGFRVFFQAGLSEATQAALARVDSNECLISAHIQRMYNTSALIPGEMRAGISVLSLGAYKRTITTTYTGGTENLDEQGAGIGINILRPAVCSTEVTTRLQQEASNDLAYVGGVFTQNASSAARTLIRPLERIMRENPSLGLYCIPDSENSLEESARVIPGREENEFFNTDGRCPYAAGTVQTTEEHTVYPRPYVAASGQHTPEQNICHNAIVIGRREIHASDLVLVTLGDGDNSYSTQLNQSHFFLVGSGHMTMQGSASKNDTLIFTGLGCTTGQFDLQKGDNLADFSTYCSEDAIIHFSLSEYLGSQASSTQVTREVHALAPPVSSMSPLAPLVVKGIFYLLGRKDKQDEIRVNGQYKEVNGQGGNDTITILSGAAVDMLTVHPGDNVTLIGQGYPMQFIIRHTNTSAASRLPPITIDAHNVTKIFETGTHLIFSDVHFTEIQSPAFNVTHGQQKLIVRLKDQNMTLIYPAENKSIGQGARFGFSTKEGYSLFIIPPTANATSAHYLQNSPAVAAILYVTPWINETATPLALVERLKSITHPTLIDLTKQASTAQAIVEVSGRHAHLFDTPNAPNSEKYYIAGPGSNTYVIYPGQGSFTIDAREPHTRDTDIDLLDLRPLALGIPTDARLEFSCNAEDLKLSVYIPVGINSTAQNIPLVTIRRPQLANRKLNFIESPQSQYQSLPNCFFHFSMHRCNSENFPLDPTANVLQVSNRKGMSSVVAERLMQLKYSAIELPHILPSTVQYYRQGNHFVIRGKNEQMELLALTIANFYSETIEKICGKKPCRLALILGKGTSRRILNGETVVRRIAENASPYDDYLKVIHSTLFDKYRLTRRAMHSVIPFASRKVTLIDFTPVMTPTVQITVQQISPYNMTFQILTNTWANDGIIQKIDIVMLDTYQTLPQRLQQSTNRTRAVFDLCILQFQDHAFNLLESCREEATNCSTQLNTRIQEALQASAGRATVLTHSITTISSPSQRNRSHRAIRDYASDAASAGNLLGGLLLTARKGLPICWSEFSRSAWGVIQTAIERYAMRRPFQLPETFRWRVISRGGGIIPPLVAGVNSVKDYGQFPFSRVLPDRILKRYEQVVGIQAGQQVDASWHPTERIIGLEPGAHLIAGPGAEVIVLVNLTSGGNVYITELGETDRVYFDSTQIVNTPEEIFSSCQDVTFNKGRSRAAVLETGQAKVVFMETACERLNPAQIQVDNALKLREIHAQFHVKNSWTAYVNTARNGATTGLAHAFIDISVPSPWKDCLWLNRLLHGVLSAMLLYCNGGGVLVLSNALTLLQLGINLIQRIQENRQIRSPRFVQVLKQAEQIFSMLQSVFFAYALYNDCCHTAIHTVANVITYKSVVSMAGTANQRFFTTGSTSTDKSGKPFSFFEEPKKEGKAHNP